MTAQAETGEVSGNVAFVNDGGVQGVWSPDRSGNAINFSTAPLRGYVDICVTVPLTRTYTIRANVRGPNGSSNSWWMTIDQHAGPARKVSFEAHPLYQDIVAHRVTLSAGEHIIRFWVRDDGTYLDRISLS